MRRSVITFVALAALLALPGVGTAQGTQPPDNAAVDQYSESIPGPTGKTPSRDVAKDVSRGGGSGDEGLPTRATTALESLGSDGQAVADFAAATIPPAIGGVRRDGRGAREGRPGIRGVVGQAVGATGEGGMGMLLPLILAGALLAAIAAAVARRRRRPHGSE